MNYRNPLAPSGSYFVNLALGAIAAAIVHYDYAHGAIPYLIWDALQDRENLLFRVISRNDYDCVFHRQRVHKPAVIHGIRDAELFRAHSKLRWIIPQSS